MNGSRQRDLDELLQFDLGAVAHRLGLLGVEPSIDDSTVVRLLNLAEALSRGRDTDERSTALLIAALLWEHRQASWNALPAFLTTIFGRLGLFPTAMMLQDSLDDGVYAPMGSLRQELRFVAGLDACSVQIGEAELTLSGFQRRLWDAIHHKPHLGVSAPTSAGKSYVLAFALLSLLQKGRGTALYIVPTLTLMDQVSQDLQRAIRLSGLSFFEILHRHTERPLSPNGARVYVVTQERAAHMLHADKMEPLRALIVDEIQNVERVADTDDERAFDLLYAIQEVHSRGLAERSIVCGPRIADIQTLARELLADSAEPVVELLPPVVNMTYSISRDRGRILLNQHCTLSPKSRSVELDFPKDNFQYLGRVRYGEQELRILNHLLGHLKSDATLVFAPTKSIAEKIARGIISPEAEPRPEWGGLQAYLAESVHEKYVLTECILAGVAYHHGGLPYHARLAVEDAFRGGLLNTVVATTTLLQGANFPIKNLISRNPHLSHQKTGPKLTPYEFANLRGRAGRLLKDLVGRAIVLDQGQFVEADIDLSRDADKRPKAGFADRFAEYRQEIEKVLSEGHAVSKQTPSFNDMTVFVRYMVARHGRAAFTRLRRSGIDVSESFCATIHRQLLALAVPIEIITANPHWDPIVLDRIYRSRAEYAMPPEGPFAQEFVARLKSILTLLQRDAPWYYGKYFGHTHDKYIKKVLIAAQGWIQEKPLREIINWKKNVDSAEVDAMLAVVNPIIVYELPKIMKPIVDMRAPDSSLLGSLEAGAFSPLSLALMDLGLPRETACKIRRLVQAESSSHSNNVTPQVAITAIESARGALNDWERRHLEHVGILERAND